MKFLVVALILLLSGCSSPPDPKYTRLAKEELHREYALGSLPGTPDNLELIEAARKKRAVYLEKARKRKGKKNVIHYVK